MTLRGGEDSSYWHFETLVRLSAPTKAPLVCAVFAAWCASWLILPFVHAQSLATTQPTSAVAETAVDDAAAAELRIREHLIEASQILTLDTAPALFRELCEDPVSRPVLTTAARRARERLDSATTELNKLAATGLREGLEIQRDQLETFAILFASLGGLTNDPISQQRVITACGELAALFDVEDKRIAEAAKLWQGVAYRRAGRPDRALQVLRPVLNKPTSAVIGYWARLERARALGDEGQFAAGVALCLRLESLNSVWFKEGSEVHAAARRTARQVRAALLNQWAKRLEATGRAKAAQATANKARELAEELLRVPESKRLLKLERAIEPTPAGEAGLSNDSAENEPASPNDDEAGDPADSEQFDDPEDEDNQRDEDTGV